MDSKILNDTAVQILLLTIVSIVGVHFYEVGYCRFFGIPTEFISFELNKYSYILFAFLATFSFIAMILDSYVANFLALTKLKNKYVRSLIILIFIGLLVFSFKGYLKFLTQQEIITLVFVFLFGAILVLNKHKPDSEEGKLDWTFSINKYLSRKLGATLGPLFMISTVICAIMFCMGYVNADRQYIFMVRPDNKTVLLKKYDNNIVLGVLENGKINQIIIEHDVSRIDTFHVLKIE